MAKATKPRYVKITVPKSKYAISFRERQRHTRHIMTPDGLMAGRRVVPAERSDRTGFIRIKTPVDVNKDGDTKDKVDLHKGQIIGRLPRGSSKKPERLTIRRHWSGGRIVKTHTRKR